MARRATMYCEIEQFNEFYPENAVIWVDPLDGTQEFVKGNLSSVTVLIGLTISGYPKLGIVHHPFRSNSNDGKGMTIFASEHHGAFMLDYDVSMTPKDLLSRVPHYLPPFSGELLDPDHEIKVAVSL